MTTIKRRQPPPFRRVEVVEADVLTPRLVRILLAGPELGGFDIGLPAASVRLLLPRPCDSRDPADRELVIPHWDGNEFLYEDGERPPLRTLTPVRFDADRNQLELRVVVHGEGPLSEWASTVAPGFAVGISGTGRGYEVPTSVSYFVVVGDESALPAIGVLMEHLPQTAEVRVHLEIADAAARIDLPEHPGAQVHWHVLPSGAAPGEALLPTVTDLDLPVGVRVWGAGEAAAVQRLRGHLFEERGLPRDQTNIRGYWKAGRSG